MTQNTRWVVALLTLVGVLLGGVVGYFLPDLMISLGFIGSLFVNGLRLLVIPLIVAALVSGVASIGQWRRTGTALSACLVYIVVTTVAAAGIALLLVSLVGPGVGVDNSAGFVPNEAIQAAGATAEDISSRFIPTDQIGAILSGNYFGLILLSLFLGLGLSALGSRQRSVVEVFKGIRDALMKLVRLLLYAAPVGLFFLVGQAVAQADLLGQGALGHLANYLLVIFGALLIHAVIVLPLILKFFCGRSPLAFFGQFLPAFGTALGTGSSVATMPVTFECVVDKSRVDSRAGALMIPLGSTINMDGSAIFTVVVAMFVAQVFGLSLTALQMLLILGASLIASIGAAGVPGASLVMAVMVFQIADFPPFAYAGLGLVVVADWLVQRGRAAVNVWSDAVGAAFVDQYMRQTAASSRARTSGRAQRPARRDDRTGPKIESARSNDRRSGEARTSPGRGRRQSDRLRPDRSRSVERNSRDARPSPFAVPTSRGSDVDLDASKPDSNGAKAENGGRSTEEARSSRPARSTAAGPRRRSGSDRPDRPPRQRSSTRRTTASPRAPRKHRPEVEETTAEPIVSKDTTAPTELTPSTLQRERERVSAHLASLRQNEPEPKDRPSEPADSPEAASPDRADPKSSEDRIGAGFPHIDYYSGASPKDDSPSLSDDSTPLTHESSDHPPSPRNETDSADRDDDREREHEYASVTAAGGDDASEDTDGDAQQSFGRKRVRKGEKFKGSQGGHRDSEDQPAPENPETAESETADLSFGRAKKKRTR